jgi:SPP1 family predicted phage head-tail adaptor
VIGAGTLNRRVVLEKRVQAENVAGGLTETFTTIATVWAQIVAPRYPAFVDGAQVAEIPTHRITIRYRTSSSNFDHVLESGSARRFRVQGVRDPDGRREVLDILAEELKP